MPGSSQPPEPPLGEATNGRNKARKGVRPGTVTMMDNRERFVRSWEECETRLLALPATPEAVRHVRIIEALRSRWDTRVGVQLHLYSLLFTENLDSPRDGDIVLVSWANNLFEARLVRNGRDVTSSRCRDEVAVDLDVAVRMVDSFLRLLAPVRFVRSA